ncbi:FtsK/SpoIIIE domain-containing protein [uncultured Tessaracoccus sp.]|uniref:FtsK/SpoIIIE domain-containing protein n=1 Tax=uncultured Tessaracoccus sp. TaxID=905023 RepID=UPI002622F5DE|nr:FtsK/SpoIIIE domain-containing protein [uncultured Tessaracoccus sp.]
MLKRRKRSDKFNEDEFLEAVWNAYTRRDMARMDEGDEHLRTLYGSLSKGHAALIAWAERNGRNTDGLIPPERIEAKAPTRLTLPPDAEPARDWDKIITASEERLGAVPARLDVVDGRWVVRPRPERHLTLARDIRPTDGERLDATLGREGLSLVRFDAWARRAVTALLDGPTRKLRARLADHIGVRPWDIDVVLGYDEDGDIALVVVDRAPTMGNADKRIKTWTEAITSVIPGGTSGWRVTDDPQHERVFLVYGAPERLPDLVPLADILPDAVRPDDWAELPVGLGSDGEPVSINLAAGPHGLVVGPTGSGKSQPLYSRVPVPVSERFPDGWARWGDLEVGDYLYDEGLLPTKIVAFSDTRDYEIWEVVLDDGQVLECSGDHLWVVDDEEFQKPEHRDWLWKYRRHMDKSDWDKVRKVIKATTPGTYATASDISRLVCFDLNEIGDLETADLIQTIEGPNGETLYPVDEALRCLVEGPRLGRRMVRTTRKLQQMLQMGHNVSISLPDMWYHEIYDGYVLDLHQQGEREQRERELADLLASHNLDPDATVWEFDSEEAAERATWLVRSQGRKAKRTGKRVRRMQEEQLYIVDAYPTGMVTPMRCVLVDNPRHTYLTEGFVPTHNTILLLTWVTQALMRGHEVIVVDPTKAGLDFAAIKPWTVAWADSLPLAQAVMERVYAEVTRRKSVLQQYGEVKWSDLNPEVRRAERIHPTTVIVDEYGSLVMQEPVPKGLEKDHPYVTEANERNAARSIIASITGRIAREARFVGIHLSIGLQRPDASIVSGEMRSNLTSGVQLSAPGKPPSREALTMLFPGETAVYVDEAIRTLDDGRSRGLGVIAADGGQARGMRVAYAPARTIPELLVERGVPEATPWTGIKDPNAEPEWQAVVLDPFGNQTTPAEFDPFEDAEFTLDSDTNGTPSTDLSALVEQPPPPADDLWD